METKTQEIVKKYIERIKADYPEDDKLMIDLQQFAIEIMRVSATENNNPYCDGFSTNPLSNYDSDYCHQCGQHKSEHDLTNRLNKAIRYMHGIEEPVINLKDL